jgi:hypothetical protein
MQTGTESLFSSLFLGFVYNFGQEGCQAMSSLILLLLLSQTAPPQDFVGKLPNFPLVQHRTDSNVLKPSKDLQYANLFPGLCFTMRSYVFARQDGNAPVLVGTSTCTPADTLRTEQAKRHRGRLVLLGEPDDVERR